MRAPPCFSDPDTRKMIRDVCREHNIDEALLKDLCGIVNERSGVGRRVGINEDIATALNRYTDREKEH